MKWSDWIALISTGTFFCSERTISSLGIIWRSRDYGQYSAVLPFTAALWTSYCMWVGVHKGFNKCKLGNLINPVRP